MFACSFDFDILHWKSPLKTERIYTNIYTIS
jgi:hypothetical protein